MSSQAAAELANARWSKTTKAERQKIARKLNRLKMTSMTAEERSEAARKAAVTRWAKYREEREGANT